MSLSYDLYQPGQSWLHRADPRVKLLFAVCASAVLLSTQNLWVVGGMLLFTQLVLLSARVSPVRVGWVWRITLPTMALIAVLWILFNPGQTGLWFAWRWIRLSAESVAEGLAVALRLGGMAFIVFVWLFSTDQTELMLSLVSLGVPYSWGLTLAMALRYLPTMAGIFRGIAEAQQARALNLKQGGPVRRARAYIPITVAMLISALRTSQNLSHALETRALGATRRRTYLRQLHFRPLDGVYTALILLVTAAYLWAHYALSLGEHALRLFG